MTSNLEPHAGVPSPMSLVDLAGLIRRHLGNTDDCLRCCWEFLDEYRDAPPETHPRLLAEEPETTGDIRRRRRPSERARTLVRSSSL